MKNNKSSAKEQLGTTKNVGQVMVFKSSPLPSNDHYSIRKKRHRGDSSTKLDSNLGDAVKLDLPKFSFPSTSGSENTAEKNLNIKDPTYGIKTAMNVEVISGNRLKFRDDNEGSPESYSVLAKGPQTKDGSNIIVDGMDTKDDQPAHNNDSH
ncbi:PaaI family thioesterase [Sesbania bispinosa]|nr:PaaI family thioesterase [Sesbania bispinosa]